MQKHTPLFCSQSFSAFSSFCLCASSQHLSGWSNAGVRRQVLVVGQKRSARSSNCAQSEMWFVSPQILVLSGIDQEMKAGNPILLRRDHVTTWCVRFSTSSVHCAELMRSSCSTPSSQQTPARRQLCMVWGGFMTWRSGQLHLWHHILLWRHPVPTWD